MLVLLFTLSCDGLGRDGLTDGLDLVICMSLQGHTLSVIILSKNLNY